MKTLAIITGTLIGFASLGASGASADTIVGDSISQMTFAGTERGTAYTVNSAAGRGAFNWGFGDIGSGAEVLAFAAPNVEAGEWLVVELGTNDLYYNTDLLDFAEFVAQVEATTPDDVCLGWVIPTYPDRPQDGRMEALIRGKVRQHPCHGFVDWKDAHTADMLAEDGVHPNEAGRDFLAAQIAQMVSENSYKTLDICRCY